jgi:hypothetical protein
VEVAVLEGPEEGDPVLAEETDLLLRLASTPARGALSMVAAIHGEAGPWLLPIFRGPFVTPTGPSRSNTDSGRVDLDEAVAEVRFQPPELG